MAALRSGRVSGCLTGKFLRQINIATVSALPAVWTRTGYFDQRSHLHTVRRGRGPLIQALVGCHHHGQILLVSAVAVRHNSSQTSGETVLAVNPSTDTLAPAPVSFLVSEPASVVSQPVAEQLTEAPVMAVDVLQGTGAELSLAELGLGNCSPVGMVQTLLEVLHVAGLPWWGAIVAGTIIARCAVFPLVIKGQREAAKLNNLLPEMTKLANRIEEAKQSKNKFEYSKASSDLALFQKKHNVNPFRGLLVPLAQAPVFISFFIALREMAYLPVPSLQSGGVGWFADLTAADPYFILPLAVTGTMFAILELGAETGVTNPNLKVMKMVFRIMPFVVLPLTINFPTAVFTYWMTSNLFSLGQVALLRLPAVRKTFCIPDLVTQPAPVVRGL